MIYKVSKWFSGYKNVEETVTFFRDSDLVFSNVERSQGVSIIDGVGTQPQRIFELRLGSVGLGESVS